MTIFAVVNQKGGVGKTVTAVNLAHGFALRGYRTLLVDLDPQGNVADCLGLPPGNDLYQLLFPGVGLPLALALHLAQALNCADEDVRVACQTTGFDWIRI